METGDRRKARIDLRVTPEDKAIFLRARRLSGDKSLSAFITRIVKDRAHEIIRKNERMLAGEEDRKVFFEALFADLEPAQTLQEAAKKYKSAHK